MFYHYLKQEGPAWVVVVYAGPRMCMAFEEMIEKLEGNLEVGSERTAKGVMAGYLHAATNKIKKLANLAAHHN